MIPRVNIFNRWVDFCFFQCNTIGDGQYIKERVNYYIKKIVITKKYKYWIWLLGYQQIPFFPDSHLLCMKLDTPKLRISLENHQSTVMDKCGIMRKTQTLTENTSWQYFDSSCYIFTSVNCVSWLQLAKIYTRNLIYFCLSLIFDNSWYLK